MFEELTKVTGKEAGSVSIVLAGVHGNERCGVNAFQEILPDLVIEKGTVIFAYGNPRAIEANKRFTEANLNRMFLPENLLSDEDKSSYEFKRALYLKKQFEQSDALLDIHASSNPGSKPFVICESNASKIVKYLPADLVVSGFDKIEPGGTDYYMNGLGKIGICIECGFLGKADSTQIATEAIYAFLKTREHIPNNTKSREQSHVQVHDIYVTSTDNFILSKPFADFEEIDAGQIIGTDGGKEVRSSKDGVILFAKNCDKLGSEAFLIGSKVVK